MSRHKLVKNLDLDDELEDYDGGEEYDEDGTGGEELSEEDQEQMRLGTISVRSALPSNVAHIPDKEIQESLWHYYYDVEKSVAYLVSKHSPKKVVKKENVKGKEGKAQGGLHFFPSGGGGEAAGYGGGAERGVRGGCSNPFSVKDFFADMPWLNIPLDRQATFIAPLYPRVGLLGGSSDGAPKMSKLQALAAARKKKAQEQKLTESTGVESPMAKLTLEPSKSTESKGPSTRGFPQRKRKDSNPHEKAPIPIERESSREESQDVPMETPPLDQAEPSAFANTMFSTPSKTSAQPDSFFTLPYNAAPIASTDAFAGPSPDDVVMAAQSKASGKGGKGPPKTNGEKRAEQIANGVEALKLDDTPRARSKNLDVLAEFEKAETKNAANFVVIGHVDAGKSTLMGRLLYDLKFVDQRTIDRYKKEAEKMGKSSFALAWVLDQGSEERARGVTIDIATNQFSTSKTAFTILDAPGHRDFIPNMIAGASQADFAVLVIDASTGSFESGLRGQTKEHALLVRSMGVSRIITAINKLDTVAWSQDRFLEIKTQINAFLTTAGFRPENLAFIPCSGLHGDFIARRSTNPDAEWYTGPTLVEELDNSEPVSRALSSPLRMTVSDVFRGGIQNPLSVSGRIESGSLQNGDALLIQPEGKKCFVKALERDGEGVEWAVAGQNLVIHLVGVEEGGVRVGDVVSSPSSPIQNVLEFTAKVLAFEVLVPMSVEVLRGRLSVPGRIEGILGVLDKGTGEEKGEGKKGGKKKKVRVVKPGQLARVKVVLERAVPLEAPSRVVLRSGGETVAAGLLE